MIRAILDDIAVNYDAIDGGGISEIKSQGTDKYVVQLPQEERVDVITYELEMRGDCDVVIVRRTAGVISFGRE